MKEKLHLKNILELYLYRSLFHSKNCCKNKILQPVNNNYGGKEANKD